MLDSTSAQFHAARIDCALQERTIGQSTLFTQSRWMAFYLESGHAVALTRNDSYEMSGPAVLWTPLDDDTRLKISAGSVGSYLLLSDRILGDAIGTVIEAAELRLFAQQPVMLSFDRGDPRAYCREQVRRCRLPGGTIENRLHGHIVEEQGLRILVIQSELSQLHRVLHRLPCLRYHRYGRQGSGTSSR